MTALIATPPEGRVLPFHPQIAAAIEHLVRNYADQPSLDSLAEVAGLHPHHFQRVFKRWAGISPKRFAQYLTVEHAKRLLDGRESVLGTALDTGLSGPSRLHDLFVACEAMTPGEYKEQGRDLTIRYGIVPSPFGRALIGLTERGVCWLSFVMDDEADAVAQLAESWSAAALVEDPAAAAAMGERIFAGGHDPQKPITLLLRGTNFQVKVWKALLEIPSGAVASYQQLAQTIGSPKAARAVGQALHDNMIAYLIPCHRVIRKTGAVYGYRWGSPRKSVMLAWEAAQADAAAAAA